MSQQQAFPISTTPQNISGVSTAGRVMGRRYRAQAPDFPELGYFLWCVSMTPPDDLEMWHTIRGGEYIEFCGGQSPPVRIRTRADRFIDFSMSVSTI